MDNSIVKRVARLVADAAGHAVSPPTIIYDNSSPHTTSILLFVFAEAGAVPVAVVKLCDDKQRLHTEYENLQRARRILANSTPQPLLLSEIDEFGVLCTRAVRAHRVAGEVDKTKLLGRVTGKLIRLHQVGCADEEHKASASARLMAPFAEFLDKEPGGELAQQYREIGVRLTEQCAGVSLPCIAQHGDFYFDNVLANGEQVYFMDWEDYGAVDVPAYDLFCLLLDLQLFTARRSALARLTNRRLVSTARDAAQSYFAAFALPHCLGEALLVFTLVQQYVRSCTRGHSSRDMLRGRMELYAQEPDPFRERLQDLLD